MTPLQEYIKLCHEVLEAENDVDFHLKRSRCEGYSQAVKTILGMSVWGQMVMSTDLSFSGDIPTCAGVPIYSKKQLQEQKETV